MSIEMEGTDLGCTSCGLGRLVYKHCMVASDSFVRSLLRLLLVLLGIALIMK